MIPGSPARPDISLQMPVHIVAGVDLSRRRRAGVGHLPARTWGADFLDCLLKDFAMALKLADAIGGILHSSSSVKATAQVPRNHILVLRL
jgi:hypothetical protein